MKLNKYDFMVMFGTPFLLSPFISDNKVYLIACMLSGLLYGLLKKD